MFDLLLAATALVLSYATIVEYARTKDVLSPVLFLGPMFFYGTVVDPWLVRGDVGLFFEHEADVSYVLLLNLASVVALVMGAKYRHAGVRLGTTFEVSSETESSWLRTLQVVAGGAALLACGVFVYGIVNVGGFEAAFARVKGGGQFESGYLAEAVNLGVVAAMMASLSRREKGWTLASAFIVLIGLLPNLVQGTFGGRRGPLFVALTAATLAWVTVREKAIRLRTIWLAMTAVAMSVAFVTSQRQFLYLGSDESVQWSSFKELIRQDNVDAGNNFIYGAGFVVASRHADSYTWGRELAVNLFVRPIPRQLWPTKYEDVGATWVTAELPGIGHLTYGEWLSGVGWLPLAGSSAISISDLYGEFSWGAVLILYLIGRGYSWLDRRRRTRGGVWELLYLEALILSIYLATQSFSAFYHRYLLLAIPTAIAWKIFVQPRSKRSRARRSLVHRASGQRTEAPSARRKQCSQA